MADVKPAPLAATASLGEWKSDLTPLHKAFVSAAPFPHVVIDNFFSTDVVKGLLAEFGDAAADGWHVYWNPLEKKYALNDFDSKPFVKRVFELLQSAECVALLKGVSGIESLESDPHLHGAGLHFHPRGGKLDMHLDAGIHPISGRERRLNLIVYLNEAWDAAWGGALQMWDTEFTRCVAAVEPRFNSALLFQTSDTSYHGLPRPIQCPHGEGRKSLSIFYYCPPSSARAAPDGAQPRQKAQYRPLPGQPVHPQLAALYQVRQQRLITPADLWPGWEGDGGGWW